VLTVTDHHSAVTLLLDRLVRQERESIRLGTALVPRPRFEDVFELYRASGFLYPAKLAALEADMPSIERTWRGALEGRRSCVPDRLTPSVAA
jgi:hypothetical protein